jgi:enoyl-CoA hydratase
MGVLPEFKNFLLSVEDGIAIFTINRPEVRNAMNPECHTDIINFMRYADSCDDIRAIIITGAGDKAFIAGADISELEKATGVGHFKTHASEVNCYELIEKSIKPVIAAINGFCFGGGFELALVCDIRIASEKAMFGLPEAKLGILPGAGGTQRLSRMAGIGVAKDVILAGRMLSAADAYNYGIAMKTVPAENLIAESKKIASDILERGPLSIALCKRLINASLDTNKETGLLLETLGLCLTMETEDKKEGTSAFLNKRPAVFKGR